MGYEADKEWDRMFDLWCEEEAKSYHNLTEYIWCTANGVDIPIKNMTDQHVINTIYYLERNDWFPYAKEWRKVLGEELASRQLQEV